jgi:hypothetical protein
MTVDLVVTNPYTSNGNGFRVLFNRGGNINAGPRANSAITGTILNYNLVIALAPNTSDLVVSMLNSAENPENVLIPNIPIQTPFRIGVVVFSQAFEVYLNGKLIKTRTFASGAAATNTGAFQGPKLNNARVGNLILWKRAATAAEIRYATPSLMPPIDSDNVPISASCASPSDILSGLSDQFTAAASTVSSAISAATAAATATATATTG